MEVRWFRDDFSKFFSFSLSSIGARASVPDGSRLISVAVDSVESVRGVLIRSDGFVSSSYNLVMVWVFSWSGSL